MNALQHDLAARLDLAVQSAREAGRLTLDYFQRGNYTVERKADQSPVTAADRAAEALLRKRIEAVFPDDSIQGEELSDKRGSSPFRWVVDPIDGTKSFIHGVPLYCTLVGLLRDNEPIIGVIELPALDERVYAAAGGGAWRVRGEGPPAPASVSRTGSLAEALFLTSEIAGFRSDGQGKRRERFAAFQQLDAEARLCRTWGDGYGYFLVAIGRADVMVDPIMNLWDAAAVAPIIVEAGGRFSDWQGQPTIHSGDLVATNGALHDEVLKITRGN